MTVRFYSYAGGHFVKGELPRPFDRSTAAILQISNSQAKIRSRQIISLRLARSPEAPASRPPARKTGSPSPHA